MHEVVSPSGQQTMSSREIAGLNDELCARIISFPARQPPDPEDVDFRLVPLDPVQSDEGTVWGFRIEFVSCVGNP